MLKVKKRNKKYWQDRFEELEVQSNALGLDAYNKIAPAFSEAEKVINSEIEVWYSRIAKNNEISISEARSLLSKSELKEFKWNLEDYIKYGQENALDGRWIKELENASAKFHISKLEALKIKTQQQLEIAFGNHINLIDDMASKVISDGYYKSLYELSKGMGIGFDIASIDERKLNLLKNKPWATDGKNFSSRVWNNKTKMVNDLHKELTKNCLLGKSPDEAIKNMTAYVDKKFDNAKVQAGRLVMTEQAYFSSMAQQESFNDLDIEEFEIVATLDTHTSEVCRMMDGHHFPMTEYEVGVTAPPFHPWCRSCTCPYFDDEFTVDEKRVARDEEGNVYEVPADMKYEDWYDRYVNQPKPEAPIDRPLTEKELEAVENYVSGDGMYINDYLRDKDNPIDRMGEMTDYDEELIKHLESATNQTHTNKTLYRSVDASAVFGDINEGEWDSLREHLLYDMDNKTAKNLIDKSKGKTIVDKGFMSTTKDCEVAVDFGDFTGSEHPIVIEFSNADKVKGLDLGKKIPELDARMDQAEVLIHNNCSYKVKSITSKDGHIHITAEFDELPSVAKGGKIKSQEIAGVVKGKPMTFEEANTGKVNPNYGKEPGYSINCQSCVPTFEARQRGYDVQVLPKTVNSMASKLSQQTNLAWIDPATGTHPEYIFNTEATTPKKYLSYIKDLVKENERYSIEFGWKGRKRSGHIVNLDLTEDGLLRIKDNQRGAKEVSEWVGDKEVLAYLSKMKYTMKIYGIKRPVVPKLLRIDNMEFDYDVVSKIMEGVN